MLAVLRPDLPAVLLEPRQRRWAFLREAARAVGRPDVDVRADRHDGYDGPPAQTVSLRALALPLAELAPLVAPGGRVLVWGAPPPDDASSLAEPTPARAYTSAAASMFHDQHDGETAGVGTMFHVKLDGETTGG